MVDMESNMEQTIGTTELRQRLIDVLHAVHEERATYIVATFERSQAALINLEEYRQFRRSSKSERHSSTGSTGLSPRMRRITSA